MKQHFYWGIKILFITTKNLQYDCGFSYNIRNDIANIYKFFTNHANS